MATTALNRLLLILGHTAGVARQPENKDLAAAKEWGLHLAPAVRLAILEGTQPVVALESTIITHGMPYPENLQTAMEVEDIIRNNGAIPATIAVIGGKACIGLTREQLEYIARRGKAARKTARRDLAFVMSSGGDGATTVSATMFLAAKVGIPIFVTGGIGGVHRGGESSLDISSDLTELGRTPVAVVCAGVKSILDIPRTLEFLETQGVPVVAYGTDDFPAFFTARSGCKAPCRVDTPEACARLIATTRSLQLGTGAVVAVPVGTEHQAEAARVEAAIQEALEESRNCVSGSDTTPFLLARVNELTGGASLKTNIALIKNNAEVGAKIACALHKLVHQGCEYS